MPSIALQILEGHERGRTYCDLPTPITIGREEDNAIRLNDERASRFHAKIQADEGRVILTDLDSTNGTRVNGHLVQMRVLQPGDQILIGRSLIAFWPEERLTQNGASSSGDGFDSGFGDSDATGSGRPAGSTHDGSSPSADRGPGMSDATQSGLTQSGVESDDRPAWLLGGDGESSDPQLPGDAGDGPRRTADGTVYRGGTVDGVSELFPDGPPPLPSGLSPAQRAELSDLLSYVQQGLVAVSITSYSGDADGPHGDHMVVPNPAWRQFTSIQQALAEYLSKASQPE